MEPIHQIAARENGYVRALALKLAPAPGLAEDIAQQVFVEFLAKQEQWDLTRDVRPLLATMTRHVAKRAWRERSRQLEPHMQQLADHIRQLAEDRDFTWYTDDDKQALKECLKTLPEKSSHLVRAYYYLEITTAELAAQLNMTAVAVRQALSRLRRQLRTCMEGRLSGKGSL